jgi:hypothetical protein
MNNRPFETEVPPNSLISSKLEGAKFFDSWCIVSDTMGMPALEYFISAARKTPGWVDMCMVARNQIGRRLGLKDLGTLSGVSDSKAGKEYKPGDRVGIFTVFENTFDEALIGDKDKHLDVVLSIHREEIPDHRVAVTITTVVHVKNMLGHIYMLPVKPMHKLIAPAVLSNIGNSVQ